MIHNRLLALLRVVEFESNGSPVEIDGFRLADPGLWRSPVPSPISELWHISNACPLKCPFCYEEGDPPGGSVLNEAQGMATTNEIETRLKYYDAESGMGVFRPLTYVNEIFSNPRAFDIMTRLRKAAPNDVLSFVTNGVFLTEENIARIADLKPVLFNFSVNSLDPELRRRVLGDRRPSVVIDALALLRRYQVPYIGSLVCWPTIPWSDVRQTAHRLNESDCAILRFSLSSYSKSFAGQRYERERFWEEGLQTARDLMQELDMPIKVEPYHYMDPTFLPNVAGVIKGSPAWRAGVRCGDQLVSVDGTETPSANHALSAIARVARTGRQIKLRINRKTDNGVADMLLDDDRELNQFPYSEMQRFQGFEYGIIIVDNLKFSSLLQMRAIINRHKAQRVLLCSSELMKPIVLAMIRKTAPFPDCEVFVEVPQNHFFGGNIVLGDLLVVDDYVRFINRFNSQRAKPVDLVIIPSSPFSSGTWLRDLRGVPFTQIERQTRVKVELAFCDPLNG
jgi:MoaA/NifB/PqqE/SkfB family radical SAM enzyme